MKILHISSNGDLGGREKMLYLLVSQENADRDLTSSVYLKYPRGVHFQKMKNKGVVIYTSSGGNVLSSIIGNIRLFENFDILVFHFVDWQLFVAAVLSGRPRLYRLSGIYLLTKRSVKEVIRLFIRKFWTLVTRKRQTTGDSNNVISRKKQADLPDFRSVKRIAKRWYFSFFLKVFFNQIIVNSRYTMLCAQKYYGIPITKTKIIYNGVELFKVQNVEQHVREDLGIKPNDFVIGTVCRFDVRKRIDRLLLGFYELDKKINVKLLVVGGGDDKLEKNFKQFVTDKTLNDRVIFTGMRQDSEALIKTMDLFVLASDNETFGLALVEAMLLEKPTVVFGDSGGPAEIIGNNSFGYIIHKSNELKNIVDELLGNEDLRKEKGKKARDYALEHFSLSRFQADFKNIYNEYLM